MDKRIEELLFTIKELVSIYRQKVFPELLNVYNKNKDVNGKVEFRKCSKVDQEKIKLAAYYLKKIKDIIAVKVLDASGNPSKESKDMIENIKSIVQNDDTINSNDCITVSEKINKKTVNVSFKMKASEVFQITGRGIVAIGMINKGHIQVGDEVTVINQSKKKKAIVKGIEKYRQLLDEAYEGEDVMLLLGNLNKEDIKVGCMIEKYV